VKPMFMWFKSCIGHDLPTNSRVTLESLGHYCRYLDYYGCHGLQGSWARMWCNQIIVERASDLHSETMAWVHVVGG
jgi:hypothetical protein